MKLKVSLLTQGMIMLSVLRGKYPTDFYRFCGQLEEILDSNNIKY